MRCVPASPDVRTMRFRFRTTLLMAAVAAALATSSAPAAAASLSTRLQRAVAASGLGATTSVVAYDVGSQAVIYKHQPDRALTPASNQKLYTTAALLAGLGPSYRFQTRVALRGTQTGTRFDGNVYLIGGGDPSLSTPDFATNNLDGSGANIGLLTMPLRARGIKRVTGRLVVDDSFLDEQRFVSAWPTRYRFDESPALGALTVNQGYLGNRLYGKSSRRPDVRAGEVFRQLLRKRGIRIVGPTTSSTTPANAEIVGVVESPPLTTLLRFMNRYSDNFTAETLLRDLGKIRGGRGTTERGARTARQQLATLGVQVAQLRIADGSGLATSNTTTARNIADLLNILDLHAAHGEPWRWTLPVSGGPGTLERRLWRAPYRGRVKAKTGTVNQASALSGYVTRVNGRRYGFAIVTYNAGGVSYTRSRALQDRIAATLVR